MLTIDHFLSFWSKKNKSFFPFMVTVIIAIRNSAIITRYSLIFSYEGTFTLFHYMCSSVSGQDEPNPALWLATWAGKMALSCLLGITPCPARKQCFFQIINPRDGVLVHKHVKTELSQYPAILTEQAWSVTHTCIPKPYCVKFFIPKTSPHEAFVTFS